MNSIYIHIHISTCKNHTLETFYKAPFYKEISLVLFHPHLKFQALQYKPLPLIGQFYFYFYVFLYLSSGKRERYFFFTRCKGGVKAVYLGSPSILYSIEK